MMLQIIANREGRKELAGSKYGWRAWRRRQDVVMEELKTNCFVFRENGGHSEGNFQKEVI